MIVDCISDLHGFTPKLAGGDLLLVCGDLTARDLPEQYERFLAWLKEQPYRCKVVVAGNHDGLLESGDVTIQGPSIHYLCDSMIEFEGLKIWGSPYTPTFQSWHFMRDRGPDIKKHWDLIPSGIDILVTHGPPFGIFDKNMQQTPCGCLDLRKAVEERIKPRLHTFGHIHEGAENRALINGTIFVNASFVDVNYLPVHRAVRIEDFLERTKGT